MKAPGMTAGTARFIPVCEPSLGAGEETYVLDALRSGWISSAGSYIDRFEQGFAAYCGVTQGVAVSSGTTALHLALLALGIGPGDEVVLPSFTMVACLFAVLYCGATPVLVDAEPDTLNIDPAKLAAAISPRTKAIMVVHIFGHPCAMDQIMDIANAHGIAVLEDAAEAHGAQFRGQRCGSLGHIAAFSFYANKILATGEGGMVLTSNEAYADECRYRRNLCFKLRGPRDYSHADLGYNYRFTNLHAAIGLAQLERLDDHVHARRHNAQLYSEQLAGTPGLQLPVERPGCRHVHWMYGLRLDSRVIKKSRSEIMGQLRERGIDTRAYFQPMHRQPLLKKHAWRGSEAFPVADDAATQGFYLPSSSHLSASDIEYIAATLRDLVR